MASPIEHVVIIVKENHTFDNYFGAFPGATGVKLPPAPDPQVADPLHDHSAWLAAQAEGGGLREQYGKNDIPAYWACAALFAVRQLLYRCRKPVGTEPPAPDCGGLARYRQFHPAPLLPTDAAVRPAESACDAGSRGAHMAQLRGSTIILLHQHCRTGQPQME